MEELKELLEKLDEKQDAVWDKLTPIIKSEDEKVIHAYVSDGINEPFHYNELAHTIAEADEGVTIYLHINTPGGIIDSTLLIMDAIDRTKAKVIGRLTGTVASAGTILAMKCHELEVSNHISFMIHNYSSGLRGKGHELKAQQKFVDAELNLLFTTVYSGFLSDEEIIEVIDGKDMWMGKAEVEERWAKKTTA